VFLVVLTKPRFQVKIGALKLKWAGSTSNVEIFISKFHQRKPIIKPKIHVQHFVVRRILLPEEPIEPPTVSRPSPASPGDLALRKVLPDHVMEDLYTIPLRAHTQGAISRPNIRSGTFKFAVIFASSRRRR
jgi:hypothetical protein